MSLASYQTALPYCIVYIYNYLFKNKVFNIKKKEGLEKTLLF